MIFTLRNKSTGQVAPMFQLWTRKGMADAARFTKIHPHTPCIGLLDDKSVYQITPAIADGLSVGSIVPIVANKLKLRNPRNAQHQVRRYFQGVAQDLKAEGTNIKGSSLLDHTAQSLREGRHIDLVYMAK